MPHLPAGHRLTLVAFATSAPELVVSVDAAIAGNADISLGNVVGSNICNIALILGLCAVITPLRVNTHLFQFDAPVMLLAAAMLTIFYLTGHGISRIHGAIFFAAIILYTAWSVRQAKREAAVNTAVVEEARKSVSSGNARGNAPPRRRPPDHRRARAPDPRREALPRRAPYFSPGCCRSATP